MANTCMKYHHCMSTDKSYYGVKMQNLKIQIDLGTPISTEVLLYSTPKETDHLYAFTVVKKNYWR